jgi:hypothetical protein
VVAVWAVLRWRRRQRGPEDPLVAPLVEAHFRPVPLTGLVISERKFPFRVRTDLQRAVDRLFTAGTTVCHFCGVRKQYSYEGLSFTELLAHDHGPATVVAQQYEAVDVGEDEPVRCLKNGLWLLREGPTPFAVLLARAERHGCADGLTFQVATPNSPGGTKVCGEFFKHLESSVLKAESYRGKVLSLEVRDSYSGEASGIAVHRLRPVAREDVILPRPTLELLERNVLDFVRQRPRLASFGQPTRKGLLFYGPPGTGKTHTIRYLAGALPGHTTLLITAEQVGHLDEYMALARLLQPSIVVIEDADLIARERTQMGSACEEVLLNKLLNEMDGLREDANVLFVLTTNRPEALEAALASRPGRIDQAIEFPLPDAEGRDKLVRLYARGAELTPEVVTQVVRRTERVSAAFIKELMRRSVQFHLERGDSRQLAVADVDNALAEMLFRGGSLNLKLLGGNLDAAEEDFAARPAAGRDGAA